MTKFTSCPVCGKSEFVSRNARDIHVVRCRKRQYANIEFPQVERAFEGLEPKTRENKEPEKPKSIPRETKAKSNLRDFWREEMERKIEEYKEGKFENIEDCASEYYTILQTEGMEKNVALEFYNHLKKRLFALSQTQFVAPQPNSQPQPQPQREPTLTEQAEIEADRVNRQRGYSRLIERNWSCEICGRGNMTREEAVSCEQSHQTVTTTQYEKETPSQQEPEIERPRQIQPLPQSDVVIKSIKGLLDRFMKPQKQKEAKREEQTQPQEETYSPITYMNTVRWTPPEPVPIRVCEVCGETAEIGAFLAGHHGKGRCG
jgi:hypothetical protein